MLELSTYDRLELQHCPAVKCESKNILWVKILRAFSHYCPFHTRNLGFWNHQTACVHLHAFMGIGLLYLHLNPWRIWKIFSKPGMSIYNSGHLKAVICDFLKFVMRNLWGGVAVALLVLNFGFEVMYVNRNLKNIKLFL